MYTISQLNFFLSQWHINLRSTVKFAIDSILIIYFDTIKKASNNARWAVYIGIWSWFLIRSGDQENIYKFYSLKLDLITHKV